MSSEICAGRNKTLPLQPLKGRVPLGNPYFFVGAIAQLVEQRTENPCVPGSIPGGTTIHQENAEWLILTVRRFFLISLSPLQRVVRRGRRSTKDKKLSKV